MSEEKYVITKLTNRKPILIDKIKTEQKDDGVFLNYHETIISQIVDARENKEFEVICSEIQKFIEKENIDACFVINKTELIDCLQEHQKLKLQIADLEAKLAEKDKEIDEINKKFLQSIKDWKGLLETEKTRVASRDIRIEELESQFAYEWECNKKFVEYKEEINQLKQQLAEKEEQLNATNRAYWELVEKSDDKYLNFEILLGEKIKLEQQLAEKEHELDIRTFEAEMNAITITKMRESKHQDKISFAIQQLERVKERYPRKTTMMWSSETEDGFEFPADFIDKIIKEIGGENGDV